MRNMVDSQDLVICALSGGHDIVVKRVMQTDLHLPVTCCVDASVQFLILSFDMFLTQLTPSMEIYDTMQSLQSPIGTHYVGYAYNLAGFLLASAKKLDKFERVDFRIWQKKMHFLLSSMSVVYVLTTHIPEDGGDDATVEQIRKRAKMLNLSKNYRIPWRPNIWLRMHQDSDKPKGNNVAGPLVVNMVEHNNSSRYNDNRGKHKHYDNIRADPNKKAKPTCWKCGKTGHIKRIANVLMLATKLMDDDVAWWVDSGATVHVYLRFSSGKIVLLFNVLHVLNMRKNLVSSSVLNNCGYKQVIESNKFVLSKHGLSQWFWGKAMLTACYLLNMVPNKRSRMTPYELWTKRKPNMNYLRVWGCRVVIRLPYPKLKTLGERGIECIFVGYAEHSKAFRFYVIEPNDSVLINSIFESMDAIFDENRLSSVPRPSLRIPNGTEDISGSVVPEEIVQQPEPELRKSKRNRTSEDFRPEFQLYLIEETRDEVSYQHSYCFNVEDDPKTFDEAMKSQDVAFWKELINYEINSIMGNNTWLLADLPQGCKPLSCKWIFKRKLKVDGTIETFKARLLILGFKQKSEIDYFNTYALVACISTIRLLIAMASIHNLVIHQMDVKTAFLNGNLDEEVYMNKPHGFIMPGNENKLDLTKEFLSSKFSIKDMGEADIILGIRIKHESNGIAISQSHYIKKVLKKFNYFDCTLVSTPMDISEKLMPNNGQAVSQLKYSRVIGCLVYAMTYTRPVIAFDVGKLSRYTSNPGTQHWQAIQRVFLLGVGAISWASKKQTCITDSTMESKFVALAAAVLDVVDPPQKSATSTDNDNALDDDDEEVEEVFHEHILSSYNQAKTDTTKGASTPYDTTSNGLSSVKGSRIILSWNPDIVKVVVISFDAQVMHTSVYFKDDKKELFCFFVYAHNRYLQWRDLWCNLITHKAYIHNRPWCILGDFNVSFSADEKSTGTSYIDTELRDFQECVEDLELLDVNSTGLRFTWNQKPKGDDGILKKIDRIMANLEFYVSFVESSALFQPYRISYHSLVVLCIPMHSTRKPRPFKFYNLLVHNTRFKDVVTNGWQISISGFWMFKVVKRLKLLKKPLRKLLYDQGNLHENVKRLWHELDEAQRALDSDPSNLELREEEAAYLQAFNDALLMEERFLSQKAKVACVDGEQVPVAFIDHYTAFLGQQGVPSYFDTNDLFCKQLTIDTANHMVRDVTDKEIREAIFSMGDNKAPGLDSYSASFFKEAWDIIAGDVTKAIKEFFINGVLLKELNHTIIALIPKVTTPMRINDYRPISCCNVLCKCISRIISNWMKESLSDLVSLNQSAFVPGRRISDNILLTQELMHNYHLDRGKRGLRQGDPMSPYLFTLVMEVLTLILNRRARDSNRFTYHWYCSKLNIINLCFANNLFLFAHGDVNSARVIMDSLEEFKNASGITLSKLSVKYLGVPLVPSRLLYRDCSGLIEKIKRRVSDWKNKSLSLAGRAQLIRSVLSSMHLYWASVFILPSSLMLELEQVMRGFLWCQGEMRKGKAKVAWEDVCLPKKEGGLGIRRLEAFNKALISSHIWSLLSHKESLWVKWIHTYKLNGRTFWEIPLRGKISWGWRKILQVRQLVRPFIWYRLGNGAMTSAWFDNWCSIGPIEGVVSNRDIYSAGFRLNAKVRDIINNGSWGWPNEWNLKYPCLVNIVVPQLSNTIPRHVVHLWLVIKRKLKTQDSLRISMKKKRSQHQVIDIIMSMVHLMLLTCRFKKTTSVQMLIHLWKLPTSLIGPS
ncbi:zinc finger, CCHC-type containing protein [Tanacetum coccineum]